MPNQFELSHVPSYRDSTVLNEYTVRTKNILSLKGHKISDINMIKQIQVFNCL